MNIWMIGKSLMEQHYPKKKNLWTWKKLRMKTTSMEIEKLGKYHDLYLKS